MWPGGRRLSLSNECYGRTECSPGPCAIVPVSNGANVVDVGMLRICTGNPSEPHRPFTSIRPSLASHFICAAPELQVPTHTCSWSPACRRPRRFESSKSYRDAIENITPRLRSFDPSQARERCNGASASFVLIATIERRDKPSEGEKLVADAHKQWTPHCQNFICTTPPKMKQRRVNEAAHRLPFPSLCAFALLSPRPIGTSAPCFLHCPFNHILLSVLSFPLHLDDLFLPRLKRTLASTAYTVLSSYHRHPPLWLQFNPAPTTSS